jgi:hypothetical protein
VRNIATKHLLDMLVSGGARLTTALGRVLGTTGPGGIGPGGGPLGKQPRAAAAVLAATVAEVLVAVARDHATTTMAVGGEERRRDRAGGYGAAINGNKGRHPLWWSSACAFRQAAKGWVGLVLAHRFAPGGSDGGDNYLNFADPETLQAELEAAVQQHRDREALARRIPTQFRTPEAAQEMLLRPNAGTFGPNMPTPRDASFSMPVPWASSPGSRSVDGAHSWIRPSSSESETVAPDESNNEGEGEKPGFLQVLFCAHISRASSLSLASTPRVTSLF